MARVIADSSALIGLQRIDRLDLLHHLFGDVLVPPAVVREVTYKLPELPAWIRTQQLTRSLPPEVGESAKQPALASSPPGIRALKQRSWTGRSPRQLSQSGSSATKPTQPAPITNWA